MYRFSPTGYGITASNEEIERYYNNNKAQYIDKPAQIQVRRILLNLPLVRKKLRYTKKRKN